MGPRDKYDGYRTQLVIDSQGPRAFTRNGFDWTEKYGPVVAMARTLRCRSAIIDGEMCVQNAKGVTDFGELRRSIRSAPERLVLFAFDLLYLDGRDLRGDPLGSVRFRACGERRMSLCPREEKAVRGIAQSGSAIVLGTIGRRFESCCPDQNLLDRATASGISDRLRVCLEPAPIMLSRPEGSSRSTSGLCVLRLSRCAAGSG